MPAIQFTGHGALYDGLHEGKVAHQFINADTGRPIDVSQDGAQVARIAPVAAQKANVVPSKHQAVAEQAKGNFNVISLAKKRKKWLEAEIKKLRMFEKEHAELTRLLDAASRPLAAVRNIKDKAK